MPAEMGAERVVGLVVCVRSTLLPIPYFPSPPNLLLALVCVCVCVRWDEVRHQAVSLLATFLTEDGGVPPPVDLQNFVAFQDGFDKLFKAVGEASTARGEYYSCLCCCCFWWWWWRRRSQNILKPGETAEHFAGG